MTSVAPSPDIPQDLQIFTPSLKMLRVLPRGFLFMCMRRPCIWHCIESRDHNLEDEHGVVEGEMEYRLVGNLFVHVRFGCFAEESEIGKALKGLLGLMQSE
jgi:hypothetical protein